MKTLMRLLSYLKRDWKTYTVGLCLLFLTVLLEILGPMIGKRILDDVLSPLTRGVAFPKDLFLKLLGTFFLVGALAVVLRYLSTYLIHKASNQISKSLRDDVYEHVHKLPISWFDRVPAGSIVSRITNDTEAIRTSFFNSILSSSIINLTSTLGLLIAIAIFNYKIALLALTLFPLMYLFNRVYSKKAGVYLKKLREYRSLLNAKLNENFRMMPIIHAFGKEEAVQEDFNELSDTISEEYAIFNHFDWGMFEIPSRFISLLTFLLFASLAYQKLELGIPYTVGSIYLILDYVSRLLSPMVNILENFAMGIESLVAAERVFEVLDLPVEDPGGEKELEELKTIRFDEVNFSYLKGQPVLFDINFEVQEGETVAFVGPTGSGKSSLFNLLFRFYDPDSGAVFWNDTNLKEFNRRALRKSMGIVLQDPFLFEGSLLSNITMGSEDITREDAEKALIRVGADHLLQKLPKGLDEPLLEKGKTLSSGERQLISFARALAFNPKILVLDEATSSIDTETEAIIQRALEVLTEGRTTFLIAHRLATIRNADRIYVLKAGRIVERGSHEDLLKMGGEYAKLVEMQTMQA